MSRTTMLLKVAATGHPRKHQDSSTRLPGGCLQGVMLNCYKQSGNTTLSRGHVTYMHNASACALLDYYLNSAVFNSSTATDSL